MSAFDLGRDHSRRELPGYGPNPPNAQWPNNSKVCISFVVNYEEGGENVAGSSADATPSAGGSQTTSVSQKTLNHDEFAEKNLTEAGVGSALAEGRRGRNLNTESGYDYGAHRGFYRILNLFKHHKLIFTSWAVGRAVELNPQVVALMEDAGCEVASHSWRWIDYFAVSEEEERKHVKDTIKVLSEASQTKKAPQGWYTGRQSVRTRRIVYETYRDLGLLDSLYDSDAYDEDLPYYVTSPSPSTDKPSPPLLVIPYTLDNNDMKFAIAPGFTTGDQFYAYLKDALDTLIDEGNAGEPKMMSIGLHCRIIGRPGRFKGLQRFVEYVKELEQKGDVWIATRAQIAEHWRKTHPPPSNRY